MSVRIQVMKKVIFPLICVMVGLATFGVVVVLQIVKAQSKAVPITILTPTPTLTPYIYNSEPPKQSLAGKITRVTGTATMLTREFDDPIETTLNQAILEGEQITASPSSSVDIKFAQNVLISMGPESILAFPSTNPKNFLVKQDKGEIFYETDETVATISARSMHGLFTLSQGKAQLEVDPDESVITFMIAEGSGKIGYIDTDNKTQIVEIEAGETAIFDDEKRKVRVR